MLRNKLPVNPDPSELNTELKRDVFRNINCAQIGIINAFDASDQSATIQIAMKQIIGIEDDGTKILADYPLILKCPVVSFLLWWRIYANIPHCGR